MTRNWHNPDRAPSPAELAAWADGELDPADAGQIEAYLAKHPDAVAEAEAARRVVSLFRDHAPPEPSTEAWTATFDRIDAALAAHQPRQMRQPRRWSGLLIIALTAAAMLGGVLLAGRFLPAGWLKKSDQPPTIALPREDDNDIPFAVAEASEINIISMDADDADRVLMGQPLLGTFEVASPEDINVVEVEPNWDEGNMPRFQRGGRVPMVVVARADQ